MKLEGKKFFGVILIILGIAFLLDELGIMRFGELIGTYWPLILIVLGLANILKKNSITSGMVLILVGFLFQTKNFDIIPFNLWNIFWPVLLILIGISAISSNKSKLHKSNTNGSSNENRIDCFTAFSGLNTTNNSQEFEGGSTLAIFGGIEIDLREAKITGDRAYLDLKAIFGGIEIKVPEDWKVVAKGIPLFGSWENQTIIRYSNQQNTPVLEVQYLALFGGIEIKN